MAARERRSKKQSASSGARPDASEFGRVVFFVDRSLRSKYVPEALRAAGARVEIHQGHFSDEAEDVDWLGEAGRRGWIVLTKDDRIRYRTHEVAAIERAGVRAFVLTTARMRGSDMATLFSTVALKLVRLSINTPPPFVFALNRSGELRRVL
jgi:hypothetical protein